MVEAAQTKVHSQGLRLLQLAAFLSTFDRFVIAPMLVTIAAAFGASLAQIAMMASIYYLLYGGMQPVWGMLSDRLGRVRVMRLTLFAAALFAGSGVATTAAAPLAEAGSFQLLFALSALLALPLGIFASLARHRYSAYEP